MAPADDDLALLPHLPYRGIQPFRYVDSPIFFAREEETRLLLQLVSVYRGVMLYGDSGVGKSSLINAGLLPAAARLGFEPERIRVQPRAGEEIVIERIPVGDEGGPYLTSSFASGDESSPVHVLACDEFAQRVREIAASGRRLLVFDQFEELVTLFEEAGEQTAQQRVTDMLGALLREELPVKLLFVFREDYLARVKPLLAAAPELIDQALRLRPPAAEALPTIIRGPFERHPGQFERELGSDVAERLRVALADRFGSGDVSLSEVQTVCLRLWRSDVPDALLEAKGVQGLLEDYLGEELDRFPDDLRYAAGALLSQMVTAAGTRNVISADDLIEHVQDEEEIPRERLDHALDLLERESKLVRRERRRDLYLYEITSEFLVPWISRRRQELIDNQERRRFRRRLLFSGAAIASATAVAVIATAGLLYAREQRDKAQTKEGEASASAAVAQAASMLGTDPGQALELALDAEDKLEESPGESSDQAKKVLTQAATASRLDIVLGGTSPVIAEGFIEEGRRLILVRANGAAEVWDVATPRRIGALPTQGAATQAVFSRNGRVVAIKGVQGWKLWDTGRRRLLTTLRPGLLALSPDGSMVAHAVPGRARVTLTAVAASGVRPGRELPPGPALQMFALVSFTADGRRLLGVSGRGGWALWDVRTRRRISSHPAPPRKVRPSSFTGLPVEDSTTVVGASAAANQRRVAVATNEGQLRLRGLVRVYDAGTGKRTHLRQLTVKLSSIAATRAGALVLAADDGSVEVWNPGATTTVLRGRGRPVTSVVLSPDDAWVVGASADATGTDQAAKIWDAETGELRATLVGETGAIRTLAFSPSGDRVVTTTDDGTARLWRTLAAGMDIALKRHRGEVGRVSFSRDGRSVVTASADRSTFLVRAATGELERSFGTAGLVPESFREYIQSQLGGRPDAAWLVLGDRAALNEDGTRLVTGSDATGEATLWNAKTGERLRQVENLYPEAVFTDVGPRGQWTLVATSSRGVAVFDSRTGRRLRDFPSKGSRIWPFGAVVSADGKYLVTAEYDYQRRSFLRVWDVAARRAVVEREIKSFSRLRVVAIDPKGRYAAGGNWNGDVWIWRISDEKLMAKLKLGSSVRALQLSPDGRRIVTATDENVAVVWNVQGGKRVNALEGHRGAINSIEFSLDGTLVVTASDDGTVRVWGADDAKTRAEFRQGRAGSALDASFDPAGRRIVVGASDGSSDIYACPVCGGEDELVQFAREQAVRMP